MGLIRTRAEGAEGRTGVWRCSEAMAVLCRGRRARIGEKRGAVRYGSVGGQLVGVDLLRAGAMDVSEDVGIGSVLAGGASRLDYLVVVRLEGQQRSIAASVFTQIKSITRYTQQSPSHSLLGQ